MRSRFFFSVNIDYGGERGATERIDVHEGSTFASGATPMSRYFYLRNLFRQPPVKRTSGEFFVMNVVPTRHNDHQSMALGSKANHLGYTSDSHGELCLHVPSITSYCAAPSRQWCKHNGCGHGDSLNDRRWGFTAYL